MTDEQHRMQMSLYKATREGGAGADGTGQKAEENPDDDYVRATSGNRYVSSGQGPRGARA